MLRIAEDELIERIGRRIPSKEDGALRIGIGHDAAVIRPRGRDWVITCDQFLEGVHFLADKHPPDWWATRRLLGPQATSLRWRPNRGFFC